MKITGSVQQNFLNAALDQDADGLEKLFQTFGNKLASSNGEVVREFQNDRFSFRGNAIHLVFLGRYWSHITALFQSNIQSEAGSVLLQKQEELDRKTVRCVKLLADYGVDVNGTLEGGTRPLHQIVKQAGYSIGCDVAVECIEALLSKGASPLVFDDKGLSPLRHCEEEGLAPCLIAIFEKVHPGYREKEEKMTIQLYDKLFGLV